ncbi:Dipeptide transport system permease protein DppC [Aeoliella mucimassa]|uniref:Oligopeptide transport system permease protein OppC n=2 Tax=Aeoliella mucimassa TaxID=2527972 RepID=A0A518AUN9_9BACT|nr:Dipeptide transport system permease protein DppC [Aeoliella mucimassa]
MSNPAVPPVPSRAGKSLWSDAWSKLRRNRLAMFCLTVLMLVGLGAFFTPLIPLQPSDNTLTDRDFEPPRLTNAPDDKLTLTLDEIRAANDEAAVLEQTLSTLDSSEKKERAKLKATIHDIRNRPYVDAGFTPHMGGIAKFLTRMRLRIFGDYSLPSLAGRDNLGRDVLSRIFWGARVSIIVSIVATMVSLLIGVSYGAVSGYMGGFIDAAMMRMVDVLYSVPFIFVVVFLLTLLGEEKSKKQLGEMGIDQITIFYLVVGAIYWLTMARVVRGQVLSLKKELYVEAARAQGAGEARIILRHIVPNVMSVVIVYLTLTIPRVMLFEAFLSFLGLGVESPDVSWGMMASDGLEVINPIKTYWWLVVFPSLAIGATLFALNFFGDSLRDALDPKLRDA